MMHAFLLQAPAAIAICRGPDLVVEIMNPLFSRLLRDRPVVGRPIAEGAPELRGSSVHQTLQRVYSTGESLTGDELPFEVDRRGDGTREDVYFRFTAQPMRDRHGAVEGVIVFGVDVTDQVVTRQKVEQLAAQLDAERKKLEQVIEQMPHAVFIAEAPTGRLLMGNRQVVEQLRKPFVRSESYHAYNQAYEGYHLDGRRYEPHEWPIVRAITRGEVVKSEPVEMVRGDGTPAIIEYSAAPIRDAQGRIIAGVVVGVDAGDRGQVLREEHRRAEQLKEMAEVALVLSAAPTMDELLQGLTNLARSVIGAHQSVSSMTTDSRWAQAIHTVSLSDKYARWCSYEARTDGSGIYTLVCQTNRPIRLTQAELEAHPRWRGFGKEATNHPPMRGWLAAPLVARDGRNLGLIQLSDKYEGEFTEEDEAILVQLAQLASVAVENAQLREQTVSAERRFRSLVEATTAMVWTTTPEGRIEEDSPSWRAFTGQSFEELRGEGWLNVIHPEDRERCLETWRRAIETRSRYEEEYRLRRRDGTWAHTVARAVPIVGSNGSIIEWVGCNTDITDMRRAEEALRTQHHLLRTLTENATLGLLMMDARQHCTFMNPAAERITGFTFAEVQALDRPVHYIIHHARPDGSHYPMEECPIDQALPTRNRQQGEDVLIHKDGTFYPVAFTASPILDGDEPVGTLIEVRDITQQKRADEERERLIQALARSNAELDQFAYVASHDLRAPLRGIASLSQWIEEDLGDTLTGELREHMTLLRGRVHRMEALIDGILDYSRAGRVRHKVETVDVGRLLADVVELLAPKSGVSVELQPDMPTLITERVPLQQVFMNLVGNALKHARREDARVRVGAREAGPFITFSVSDNGQGIAPQYHERIWGLFQRLEARDKVEGAGIGLSVVKKIVESRGGRAWVESAEGQGATFSFTWPRRERG